MANSIEVAEIQATAQANISGAISAANAFQQGVSDFINTALVIPAFTIDVVNADPLQGQTIMLNAGANAVRPLDFDVGRPKITVGAAPGALTVTDVTLPVFGTVPQLIYTPPPINLPLVPDATLPSAPGNAPATNVIVTPDAISVTVPDAPQFANIDIPAAPSTSIPTFTTTLPTEELLAPSNTFSFSEQAYQDPLLDNLKIKLMSDLLNGGYGIEPLDEQALWERARERESVAANAAVLQATTMAAARGFALPPGALIAQIEGAQQAALEKISSVNRDIALKRADLYVQNRQFTIQQSQVCEQMLITYFGYMMERALNYAKYQAEFGIQYFNAQVNLYNMRLEATKVANQVYEAQLRSALANLEAWKVTIEGAKLSADVQRTRADVYRSQLEGVKVYVDIYRTQMEAARIQADVERLKIDLFKAQVEAYVAQVGAKEASFRLYRAQIEGEEAKITMYKAEVDSYSAQVAGYASSVSALKATVDAQVAAKGLQVEVYRAQIQAYVADIQKGQAELAAQVQKYDGDIKGYDTFMRAMEAGVGSTIDAQKANAEVSISKARLASSHMLGSANALVNHDSLAATAAGGMFNTYAQEAIAYANQAAGIAIEPGA